MTAIWNWIKGEWSDPATHAWLVGAGATTVAYLNGSIDQRTMIAALIGSALGIVIPTGHKL